MAESLLFSIAQGVLWKIASPALQEAIAICSVENQIGDLKNTLTSITTVLLDAEERQSKDQGLQVWLGQLRDVLYDVEDVLNELECEVLRKHVISQYGGDKEKVHRFFSLSNPLILRVKISHRIKEVKETLSKISVEKNQFDLNVRSVDTSEAHMPSQEMTYSFMNELDAIGRDIDKQNIVRALMQPNDENLSVIPIVGMGGLGKTTLAKLVYNDPRVKEQFKLQLWVCVPMDLDLKKTIEGIIKEATGQSLSNFDIQQLQTILRDTIKDKKYLLVLDDVWSTNRDRWKQLRDLLSVGANESKIIVTTRLSKVASIMGTHEEYRLEGLSHEDSMTLFKKWAFGKKQPRPNLLEIGYDIVKKSHGVPLLVKTLGSLLYTKEEKQYWTHIRDSETWKLLEADKDILPVLKLSYDHLPSHLKPCFAILSLFSKGSEIASDNLVRLWMALGLILPKEKLAMEDIGAEYVKDLWKRSLLHIVEESESRSLFMVHDLVHSLSTIVAQKYSSIAGLNTAKILKGVRYVALSSTSSEGLSTFNGVPPFLRKPTSKRLRAIRREGFQLGVDDGVVTEEFVRTCISNCKRLRYLDLSCGSFEKLPSSICNLKQLRSLLLRENKRLEKLPDTICELQSLLQLSLHGCSKLDNLPKNMEKLVSLRFLSITTKQKSLQESGIQYLENLHFLGIYRCTNLQILFEGTCRLTHLRELEIGNCGEQIYLPFEKLIALESLAIDRCKLELTGKNKFSFPLNLRKVAISNSQQVMELLHCLDESARSLESLSVYDCRSMTTIPERLHHDPRLLSIRVIRCPNLRLKPLASRMYLQNLGGELNIVCRPEFGEEQPQLFHPIWYRYYSMADLVE
ncbi:hypothetical protein BT93_G1866 [Corymbia citriodora subsp. variegata]|nr:hypothetical protein BT93_G1866 [Corymbia citriodora subsp. variegata]